MERTKKQARILIIQGVLCEYCEEAVADGIVSSNNACVCEDCYQDQHGSLCY